MVKFLIAAVERSQNVVNCVAGVGAERPAVHRGRRIHFESVSTDVHRLLDRERDVFVDDPIQDRCDVLMSELEVASALSGREFELAEPRRSAEVKIVGGQAGGPRL